MKKKILLLILLFVMLFGFKLEAEAAIPVVDVGPGVVTAGQTTLTDVATSETVIERVLSKVANIAASGSIVAAKLLAMKAEQLLVKALVGGESGNSTIIRDFADYLYNAPKREATTQMTAFFNSTSQGRASSLNYEGVGTNYDAYLIAQAKNAINGQSFTTDIQSQVTDPATNMFSGGNMKGVMSFFQCSNNPYCYTLVATEKYNADFTKAQTIAIHENSGGFMPTKSNGRITNPASIAQNALLEVDKMGTQLSMSATNNGDFEQTPSALLQIAEGTAISTAARIGNYGIVDPIKNSIDQKLSTLPFSLSYSKSAGWNVSASVGGTNLSAGLKSYNTSAKTGNSCAVNISTGATGSNCN
ncbi:MAG: hypothetical protein WCF93_02355 [Candidatus Moraniibacteriota bacterium]